MKEGKSALDVIAAEQKSVIFKERIRLMNQCSTAKDYALNAALIHMMNPSVETMRWVIHYLKLIEDGSPVVQTSPSRGCFERARRLLQRILVRWKIG